MNLAKVINGFADSAVAAFAKTDTSKAINSVVSSALNGAEKYASTAGEALAGSSKITAGLEALSEQNKVIVSLPENLKPFEGFSNCLTNQKLDTAKVLERETQAIINSPSYIPKGSVTFKAHQG